MLYGIFTRRDINDDEKEQTVKMRPLKLAIGVVAGGVIGFLASYLGQCGPETCPFTSDPYASTLLGMLIGGLISFIK